MPRLQFQEANKMTRIDIFQEYGWLVTMIDCKDATKLCEGK